MTRARENFVSILSSKLSTNDKGKQVRFKKKVEPFSYDLKKKKLLKEMGIQNS